MPGLVRTERGTALLRPESMVVARGTDAVVTFDRAGRLFSLFLEGRFYRRGVDGRVVEKFTDRVRVRRTLDPAAAASIVATAHELAREVGVPPGEEADAIAAALEFDLDADALRFRSVYQGHVPILPPDLYRALVVQATVGCSHNLCLFCDLYRDRPFRAPGEAEFAEHVRRVGDAFGAGISMRRGVFLGDADALVLETPRLLHALGAAAALPPARDGLFCFGAGFGEPARTADEWRALAGAGLRRVYVGLETGHDPLRARLGKPGTAADVLALVRALKEAGIAAGVILLAGAGGAAFEEAHVGDSVAFCREAGLDGDDFIYLSPLLDRHGDAVDRGQVERLRAGLALPAPPRGPRVAVYDLRDFVY